MMKSEILQISSVGVKHYLAIKNVQASDNGRFTIQAMNAAGTKQSTCMLIVAPAPTPIPGAKSVALVSFELSAVGINDNFHF